MNIDAWDSNSVEVLITPTGIDPTGTKDWTSRITSFSRTGGEKSVEYEKVFGGGQIQKRGSQDGIEFSIDMVVLDADADALWLGYSGSSVLGTDADSGDWKAFGDEASSTHTAAPKTRIIVTFTDGVDTGARLRYTFTDALATSFDESLDVDDLLKGTLKWTVDPADIKAEYVLNATGLAATGAY